MLFSAGGFTGLQAQTAGTATLVGTVTDASGSVVVGAKVTAVNVATSFIAEATTSGEGSYQIPYLAPGGYRLTIESAGFKRYTQEGLALRASDTPRIDVRLELGTVAETVAVTSSAPLLETENASSGQVLEGDTLIRMPIPQKRAVRMLYYYPGAQGVNGYHVLGQPQRAIGYTVDGVNGKEPGIGGLGEVNEQISTTADAFQEVKVHTTGMPAELGHSAGGLMSIVFRSGANQFHGVAEDRYINKAMIHRHALEQPARTAPFNYHEPPSVITSSRMAPCRLWAPTTPTARRTGTTPTCACRT